MRTTARGSWPLVMLLAGAGPATLASAQTPVRLQDRTLTGVVVDRLTGDPIPHALVSIADQRQFASAVGRFRFTGVRPGPIEILATQVGYAQQTAAIIGTTDSLLNSESDLVIRLSRQALVLPELTVVASPTCARGVTAASAESDPAMTAVLENARRLMVLEQGYPFESVFFYQSKEYDDQDKLLNARAGGLTMSTKRMKGYQAGRILERSGKSVNYFTTSDLARPAFQQSHCFWHAGVDSLDGATVHLIDFSPVANPTGPDWGGRLTIDAASSRLVRSDASLYNLDSTKTRLRSVVCAVFYGEVVPLVLHETGAQCVLVEAKSKWITTVETLKIANIRFLGRKPGDP